MAIIEHIYEALLDDAAFDALPARLADMVGARSATFQTVVGGAPVHIASHYFSAEMGAYYMANGIGAVDTWNSVVIEKGLANRAVASDDIMTRQDFERGAFYNDFFRRFGDDTGISLGAIIQTRDGHVGLGLHRALTDAAYGDEARCALQAALPHLRRLAEARTLLTAADVRQRDAEAMLHGQAAPVLLTDGAGRVLFANAAAETLLDGADGLTSRLGVLRAVGPQAARLETAIARAASAVPTADAILVVRPSGAAALRVVVSPHRAPGALPGRALILIEDPAAGDDGVHGRLRQMFGLSPAEADLAVRLAEGRTPAEIAEARRVLPSTVRTQLNSLMAKTGARRQSDLVAIVARLPRPAS